MSTRDRSRPAHTGRLPLTSTTTNDDQDQRYGHGVPDDRAAFEARRAAAMPARHRQRLANLAASTDARRRLAGNPVFAPLFSDTPEPVRAPQRGDSGRRCPLFSDRQGGGRHE